MDAACSCLHCTVPLKLVIHFWDEVLRKWVQLGGSASPDSDDWLPSDDLLPTVHRSGAETGAIDEHLVSVCEERIHSVIRWGGIALKCTGCGGEALSYASFGAARSDKEDDAVVACVSVMLSCNRCLKKLKTKCRRHSDVFADLLARKGFENALANPGKDVRLMAAEDTAKLVHEFAFCEGEATVIKESKVYYPRRMLPGTIDDCELFRISNYRQLKDLQTSKTRFCAACGLASTTMKMKHMFDVPINAAADQDFRSVFRVIGVPVCDQKAKSCVKIVNEIIKSQMQCANCGSSSANILFCSRCKDVAYCSVDCQKEHWKIHRQICGPLYHDSCLCKECSAEFRKQHMIADA